jgi:microcystin-dependent protein
MSDPFVGEIRLFAGNFAPLNWRFCDGSLVQISENNALFVLIGTTYGGNGQTNFALPNLASRVPIHQGTFQDGTSFVMGQIAGFEQVTLTTQQIPSHTHTLFASTSGQVQTPSGTVIPAQATSTAGTPNVYSAPPQAANETLHSATIANDGGSQPHSNIQPYLAMNYIISMFGTFPPRT